MTRSIHDLREICEKYPCNDQSDEKTAAVNEFISILQSGRGDFCDFRLLWRLSNDEQKQKLLPIAISKADCSSDIKEIIWRYCPEKQGQLFEELMAKSSTLFQDADLIDG